MLTFVLNEGFFFGPINSFLPIFFLLVNGFPIVTSVLRFSTKPKGVYRFISAPNPLAELTESDAAIERQIEPFVLLPIQLHIVANAGINTNTKIIAKTTL